MTSETDNDGPSRSQSPDESGDQENEETTENQEMDDKSGGQDKDGEQKKQASNSKDPSRPRRKKARRACYACQRAHLTCGESTCTDGRKVPWIFLTIFQGTRDRAKGVSNAASKTLAQMASARRRNICTTLLQKLSCLVAPATFNTSTIFNDNPSSLKARLIQSLR